MLSYIFCSIVHCRWVLAMQPDLLEPVNQMHRPDLLGLNLQELQHLHFPAVVTGSQVVVLHGQDWEPPARSLVLKPGLFTCRLAWFSIQPVRQEWSPFH